MPVVAKAEQNLVVVYPPPEHQTTADKIFLIGTAPPTKEVLVNGKVISRSRAGHFAPSFPLQLGDNVFTLRYQNQQVEVKVKRLPNTPEPPVGLAFGKDSLAPGVNIARLPGELVCFGAVAPANAQVFVQLGMQTIPLLAQPQQVQLPANNAALTGQNQPAAQVAPQYQGCTTLAASNSHLRYGNNLIPGRIVPSGYTIRTEAHKQSQTESSRIQPTFRLTLNGKTITQPGTGKIEVLDPARLPVVEVTADAGVARTGASTDYSRLTPLPKGTRASVTGKEGEWLRLDYGGWINSKETRIIPGAIPPRSLIRSITARQLPKETEIVFPLQVPVPVSVQQGNRTLSLTLYNTSAQTDVIHTDDDPVISRLDWQQVAQQRVQYTFNLKSAQQWGYKLQYNGTSLVLSLRHPPDSVQKRRQISSLKGIKILLDPGHGGTETGAVGPTGYPEKDINLVISKLVREQLIARGATVYMTREDDREVSLPERVAMIDKIEPAIAISLHYNALPDSGDALNTKGFAAFWYHPQAHSLAVFLHNYVVNKLLRPDYGVYWNNLALTRPASAPSVLLELGFMINPTEFEWIVNPQEQRKLATAIAQGITEWFRSQ